MPDLTQEQAHGLLRIALSRVGGLSEDRLLWGNREAPWTQTTRHYRLEKTGEADAGWYRNKPGARMRLVEFITIHLAHAMYHDNTSTETEAGGDKEGVKRRLLNDTGLRTNGIRIRIGEISEAESDAGDTLETDIEIEMEYDFALTSEAA